MDAILVFLGATVLFFGIEYAVRKLWKVEKVDLSEKFAGKAGQWGRGILLVVILAGVIIFTDDFFIGLLWFWAFYLLTTGLLNVFLEWKYFPESKSYLVSLVQVPIVLGFIWGAIYFIG